MLDVVKRYKPTKWSRSGNKRKSVRKFAIGNIIPTAPKSKFAKTSEPAKWLKLGKRRPYVQLQDTTKK
jgi:hypothetical protein